MVQLQNATRLKTIIELGSIVDDAEVDSDGTAIPGFKAQYQCLAGKWSFSVNQMIQLEGLNKTDVCVYAVRHRMNYDDITRVKIANRLYVLKNINADAFNNSTAYDLLTLERDAQND